MVTMMGNGRAEGFDGFIAGLKESLQGFGAPSVKIAAIRYSY